MRRTKIVCTLGPSSSDLPTIERLLSEGMDIARLNFSHGTQDDHRTVFEAIRQAAAKLGKPVAVMADLQGPKIRTGRLAGGKPVILKPGAPICITTREVPGDAQCVSTTYDALPRDVASGDRLLLADGMLELAVVEVDGPDVHCTVLRGGELGQSKGVNLPGVAVSAAAFTAKDADDLEFALGLGVDYVALSFVRSADDIRALKAQIAQSGHETPVVAKIERPEAVAAIDDIIGVTDAVMVARGDLGVEMALDEVPQVQKDVVRKCNRNGVPVITATQMLESMMASARPTRAEVADIANAIHDGTDALMLSGETAVGRYPVEAVITMAQVAKKTDQIVEGLPRPSPASPDTVFRVDAAFSHALGLVASQAAEDVDAKCITCFTMTGYSARMISRQRPRKPVVAVTMSEETRRRCALYWGVQTLEGEETESLNAMVKQVDEILSREGLAMKDDTVIIVGGSPLLIGGRANFLKLHQLGETDTRQ